jgi:hypothetical protein
MYGRQKSGSIARLVVCGLALLMGTSAGAEVFKYEDLDGNLVFTDRPLKGPYKLLWQSNTPKLAPIAASNYPTSGDLGKRREIYTAMIADTAKDHNLNPDLLHAVIRAESAYNPNAVSRTGAVGLMQLMPGTASRYGVSDRTDPEANLRGGAAYLRDLLKMFDDNLQLALAGYNAGENAVIENGYQIPPYPETREYVSRVLSYYYQGKNIPVDTGVGKTIGKQSVKRGKGKPPSIAWTDS